MLSSIQQTATIIQKQVLRGFIVKLNLQNMLDAITGYQLIWFQYNPEQLEERFNIENAFDRKEPGGEYSYNTTTNAYYQSRQIKLKLTIDSLDDAIMFC